MNTDSSSFVSVSTSFYLVEAGHHRGDRGVELHVLNILRDLFDGLVHYRFELLRRAGALGDIRQGRDSLEEALATLDAALFPRGRRLNSRS